MFFWRGRFCGFEEAAEALDDAAAAAAAPGFDELRERTVQLRRLLRRWFVAERGEGAVEEGEPRRRRFGAVVVVSEFSHGPCFFASRNAKMVQF